MFVGLDNECLICPGLDWTVLRSGGHLQDSLFHSIQSGQVTLKSPKAERHLTGAYSGLNGPGRTSYAALEPLHWFPLPTFVAASPLGSSAESSKISMASVMSTVAGIAADTNAVIYSATGIVIGEFGPSGLAETKGILGVCDFEFDQGKGGIISSRCLW